MANYFRGSTTANAVEYKCGDNIRFELELVHDGKTMSCPLFLVETWGDDGRQSRRFIPGETGKLTFDTSLEKPGFVHVLVTACALDGTPLEGVDKFEGGAGAELDKITQGRPDPEDLDDFWEKQLETVESSPLTILEKKEIDSGDPDYAAYDIKLAAPGDMPASGILTMPKNAAPGSLTAILAFHGYGYSPAEVNRVPGTIFLRMNIHGFENNREQAYYDDFAKTHAGFGFEHDKNQKPDTCYFLNVILRDLQGARFIRSLPEYDGKGITLNGGSMGAMQATNIAALINDAKLLDILIPWLCDLGGLDKNRLRGWRPDPEPGVLYFDTAIMAKRVKCPVKIECGLGDYVCPPSGETVLWHNIKTQKSITFVQNMTHPYRPIERIDYTL